MKPISFEEKTDKTIEINFENKIKLFLAPACNIEMKEAGINLLDDDITYNLKHYPERLERRLFNFSVCINTVTDILQDTINKINEKMGKVGFFGLYVSRTIIKKNTKTESPHEDGRAIDISRFFFKKNEINGFKEDQLFKIYNFYHAYKHMYKVMPKEEDSGIEGIDIKTNYAFNFDLLNKFYFDVFVEFIGTCQEYFYKEPKIVNQIISPIGMLDVRYDRKTILDNYFKTGKTLEEENIKYIDNLIFGYGDIKQHTNHIHINIKDLN